MAVTQEITYLDNSAVRLTFTYNNEDLRAKYNEIVNNLAKDLQLKGFRKGKAPVSILESKMGKTLKQEVLNLIIGKTVEDAIKSDDFPEAALPLEYSMPEVEGEPVLDLSSDLVFSVKHDARPVVNVTKWEGFEVEVDTADVTQADIDRRLEEIREKNAIVMDKEDDDSAENGDIVTVDYHELEEDGGKIPDTEREDFTFTLGTGNNAFKFDDEIIGMKKDETRDIVKTYPGDFEDGDLASQTRRIRVSLKELKQRTIPDDDELAQDYDESFETIDDLKASIAKSLEASLALNLRNLKIQKILEKITEENPVAIPESMIQREFAMRIQQLLGDRVTEERAYELVPRLADEESRKKSIGRLRTHLITSKLMDDLNIEALPEDRDLFYTNMAEAKGKSFDEAKEEYINNMGGESYLDEEIKYKKFVDILLEKNTIIPGKKVDLVDIIKEIA
ncbi:MAG: trigger factor [Spirochaetaceae bacterium]|nr:trigger factor [Spirochaetaceae bacterium]